jgi:hypothetical protein
VARVGLFAVRSSHLWCELIPAPLHGVPSALVSIGLVRLPLRRLRAATIPLAARFARKYERQRHTRSAIPVRVAHEAHLVAPWCDSARARGIVAEPPKTARSGGEGDGADSPTRGANEVSDEAARPTPLFFGNYALLYLIVHAHDEDIIGGWQLAHVDRLAVNAF